MIEIRVRLFATFREQAGWAEKKISVEDGTRLHALLDQLEREEEDLSLQGRPVYAAVNQKYEDRQYDLEDGDEVALFPPVSGGQECD